MKMAASGRFDQCSFMWRVRLQLRNAIYAFLDSYIDSMRVCVCVCLCVCVCIFIIPTLFLDSSIVSPFWLWWVKGVCMFRCNLPPALLAEWLGSCMCHFGNTGVEQTLNKSQHTKLTAGIQTCNLSITSPALYQQAIPAPLQQLRIWLADISSVFTTKSKK